MTSIERSDSIYLEPPYYSSLQELDAWATGPAATKKFDGILEYVPRPTETSESGKLLVCHDFKGGYTESLSALSYSFNFWSLCDTFVYFSHHRVTMPPPGWITAAHRQGVRILGTLIFEGGAEPDCLRLLVGKLSQSVNGPAKSTTVTGSLPLSPHYARILAELAWQRGFDGYLLNFECPLTGGIEQTRTLAAWITLLQNEILKKVGSHGRTFWYDSVIVDGQLRWQDRLDGLNLPFFLSSTDFFSNYTWPPHYPNATAEYFLSINPALTGNTPDSQPYTHRKNLNDIYMGVDVWGRGSHGGGGFGCYKAIEHISPASLGLSVALFGQAWTWESEQDKPSFTWEQWWEYDNKLWVGTLNNEEVAVPKVTRSQNEPECLAHGPFRPISSFFPLNPPPDPFLLPLHTTFSPGVGRSWFVEGKKAYHSANGWTDIQKQCSVGDQVWPSPHVEWEDTKELKDTLPVVLPSISFEDAWNGGSSLSLRVSCAGSESDDAVYRSIWVPVQSFSITGGKLYEATIHHKIENRSEADVEIGVSVKPQSTSNGQFQVTPVTATDETLYGGWSKLSIRFSILEGKDSPLHLQGAIGLVIAIVTEDPSQSLETIIRLGQLNIHAVPPTSSSIHEPLILWADFLTTPSKGTGEIFWETAVSFPVLNPNTTTTPDNPVPAWTVHPSNDWLPKYIYFNIYALPHTPDGHVGQPEDAHWVGTTGWTGASKKFKVVPQNLPFWANLVSEKRQRVRFFVQGLTEHGSMLAWNKCVFVDCDLSPNNV